MIKLPFGAGKAASIAAVTAAATVCFAGTSHACERIERDLEVCNFDTGWSVAVRDEDGVLFENGGGYSGRITVHIGGFAAGTMAEQMAGLVAITTRKELGGKYQLVAEAPYDEGRFTFIAVAEVNGQPFLHANTFVTLDKHTVQINTWRAGEELSEADRLAHLSFGGLLSGGGGL